MKNDQKNSIYPSVPFSCMTNQPIHAVYMKTHLWHLKGLILELHLNLWFKWISSKLNAKCIGSKYITYSCHIHASYCCIWLCFDCRHRSLSIGPAPESVPEYLSEEQCHPVDLPGKQTPLFIPIQTYSLAPALFYCIRTTTIQLLLYAAVVEPIPLHDLSLPQ